MNTLKSKTKEVKGIRDLQGKSLEASQDDYMVGLYNGLEMGLAILESREPEFLTCTTKEPEVIENEEERTGRTVASGVRRVKKNEVC